MPRYFFDVDDGVGTIDDEGVDLETLAAAKHMAALTLAEIAKDVLPADGPQRDLSISVRDEDGRRVLRVTLSFTAEIVG